ncbi:hypothetical protein AWC38_SpisGene17788 [Stylophora pistillata]|uniref:Uncharacterized protein n=1 Tax=Stylophora pistillata TaxID=50429 RepID=A0A2B4RHL4_STYPI|nr:hypothetical protein AWC38_SpisGene17788 [Stylophora pistillata]
MKRTSEDVYRPLLLLISKESAFFGKSAFHPQRRTMIQGRKMGPVLLLVALCRTVHNLASPRTSPIHCQTIKKFILEATVGDSLSAHNNTLFGACNDVDEANHWWYIHNESNAGCGFLANLNGVISLDGKEKANRIYWAFLNSSNAGNNSPIKTEMKIRPVDFS